MHIVPLAEGTPSWTAHNFSTFGGGDVMDFWPLVALLVKYHLFTNSRNIFKLGKSEKEDLL